jgi:hypothetical protein
VTSLALSEDDRADLTRLEEAMWRAETRFDPGFQQARFAADFFEFGRSGRIYTREQALSAPSQEIRAVLPLRNLVIRLLDQNTAQTTYDSEVTYGDAAEYARRSSIWSRGATGWVMRFHQGTPYARDGSPDAR